MKLLLDMNVSPKWADLLQPLGHEVIHWSNAGKRDELDSVIVAWAAERGFVVLTSDLDFGEILAITGSRKPSVVQLRVGRNAPGKLLPLVSKALARCAAELEEGALISIDHSTDGSSSCRSHRYRNSDAGNAQSGSLRLSPGACRANLSPSRARTRA